MNDFPDRSKAIVRRYGVVELSPNAVDLDAHAIQAEPASENEHHAQAAEAVGK